ncbi:mediator of RNA polymerase II transcription subunit 15-like [Artemia franciscana]|uniref:mediator of RNA polymerase II transcription subunit 15-like n=1 Tax=Artemia franciscana TaxID=6661 RepID=UPI0032DA6C26
MADEWRSAQYRQSVVAKIEEAIRNSGNPTTKSAIEMESHFYQKAKTREDYLGFLARLLLHVSDLNKKNAQQGPMQMGGPGMPDSMGPGQGHGMVQMGGPSQPSALIAQLNQRQMNSGQGQMGSSGPQQQSHDNWEMMQQNQILQQQQLNLPSQNFNPNQQVSQGMVNQNVMSQQLMGMGQGPQQLQQGPAMMGTRPRMPIVKMGPGGQGVMQQQLNGMLPQQSQFLQQQPSQMMQQQQNQILQTQQMLQQRKMELQGGPGGTMGSRQGSQYVGLSPVGQGIQSVPSPALSGGGMVQQMAPSPHFANSPGGAQGIAPSPGSVQGMQRLQPGQQGQIRSGPNLGVPSPSMGAVNTPQHLSTGNVGGGQMDPSLAEEQMYIEKVRELGRKYIEPLRRMIEKIGNEDTEKLSKMRNLLNLLENPQKRVPMDTLLKCESVLEKMDFKKTEIAGPGSVQPPSVSFAVPIPMKETQFQSLLEAVAANIKSPYIHHTLKRTFGPVVATLSNTEQIDLEYDFLAPKKRRYVEEEEEEDEEPIEIARSVLAKEIGTFDKKFVVELLDEPSIGRKGIPVVCKLVDKCLPRLPDIEVLIPENYPFSSPTFELADPSNEPNLFQKRVLQNMEARISRIQYNFSLSQFLGIWESAVRQACNMSNLGDHISSTLSLLAGM